MASRFAANTKVPVERTRNEIETALARYGADQFISGWEHGRAMLAFRVRERMVRFELPIPTMDTVTFKGNPSESAKETYLAQETRRRWRALLLVIKAKLEAVESEITTFESEFLAHIVLPNNQTVGQAVLPQLQAAYSTGKMPPLLGPATSQRDDL